MTWTLLLTLAAIVLINRYFFLEPKIALKLPRVIEICCSIQRHVC
jgi:branched-subunit amino acid transport protein